jgi:hypothetical protein
MAEKTEKFFPGFGSRVRLSAEGLKRMRFSLSPRPAWQARVSPEIKKEYSADF